ncbi:hypothetical protein EC973_001240 [Apophysomyces ossiformis]|uniref:Box C/D snoRNA protein 1 n=1 Tax=Apophysomyces ossiformis TaxID=679940 RepID=A0A8H7BQ82_9FUNG|nr:hypothetical protein EC973_001240 [Apophysomyces ossiformis]
MDPEITKEHTQSSDNGNIEVTVDVSSNVAPVSPDCEQCHTNPWKYKCPRCHIRTCSLDCVKQHKVEKDCSGERSKTHYISMQQYSESNMMSDYVYLEDIGRRSDTLTRERLRADQEIKLQQGRAKALVRHARHLGILYDHLPIGMSRRKINTSNFNSGKRTIFWTMECYFCHKGQKERVVDHSFPGIKPLSAFFENLLFTETPQGKGSYAIIRHQNRPFVEAGLSRLVVGLKKEKAPDQTYTDVTLELDKPLNEILRGQRIIEFPTWYIWLEGEVDSNVKFDKWQAPESSIKKEEKQEINVI